MLTSADAEDDIQRACDLHANCYITKPLDLKGFTRAVQSVARFWFTTVKLPAAGG
ncbi:MAG TPA: hypothetical protein VNE39_05820 [Planctomycetota bacterium]|nr:hypothetical protein [Planctomycetota bacterium]